eukprot:Colp12_sorted_trinity150504_noHs@10274
MSTETQPMVCTYTAHPKWGAHDLHKDALGRPFGNVKRKGLTFCSQHCAEDYLSGKTSTTQGVATSTKSKTPVQSVLQTNISSAKRAREMDQKEEELPKKRPNQHSASSGSNEAVMQEKVGDLFSSTDSLAHCISNDIAMGKGIAAIFKSKFGGVDELKKKTAAEGRKVGGAIFLKAGDRYIYYLITKPRYYDKPTYETLEASLVSLRSLCQTHQVKQLSMPQIGCGLDKLEWPKVKKLLGQVFANTGISVVIYVLKK